VNAIAAYLDELSMLLPRASRRRILAEVDAHLREAAAAVCARGEDVDAAARVAVARFGEPADVARQFNALRAGPGAIARRVLAVALATVATGGIGTATVWALEPATPGHTAHVVHHARSGRHRDRDGNR
jgi:hypothetical protein